MESHKVKILEVEPVTHDVRRFRVEKPEGYAFIPGQATEVAIDKEGWRDEKRPFTFTSLNEWPDLEFVIKIYSDHDGVTHELGELKPGDHLIIHDVWGAIAFKEAGVFLAGGAGITPFIAIFRQLHQQNDLNGCSLYFSNKTDRDIILQQELDSYLGDNVHHVITDQENTNFENERINEAYIKKHIQNFDQAFYICGPDAFVEDIGKLLKGCGASPNALVFEQ